MSGGKGSVNSAKSEDIYHAYEFYLYLSEQVWV